MVKLFDLIPAIGTFGDVLNLQNSPHNFTVKEVDNMVLICYKRDEFDTGSEYAHLLRGLIIDKDTTEIICYGLNKGNNYESFKEKHSFSDLVIEESIDGTMLNLFYYGDSWRVSTRTMVNAAESKFYSKRSFLDLFMDAKMDYDLETLNKGYTYTFVLNHPENRIVTKYDKSELVHINTRDMSNLELIDVNLDIKRPIAYKDMTSYDELEACLETLVYKNEGFMLYSQSDRGVRCKVKGKAYSEVKELRGNHRNNLYRILELRKENDKKQYANYFKYYPEYKQDDYFLSSEIKNLINDILETYNKVKKDKLFIEIPNHLKTPLFELHNFWKVLMTKWTKKKESSKELDNDDQLELKKPSINYRGVHIYFLKLPVYKQYYLLKRNLEYKLISDVQ